MIRRASHARPGATVPVGIAIWSWLAVSILATEVAATPGDLDPALGGGVVLTDFGSNAHAWAVLALPDGRLVAAGDGRATSGGSNDFALARHLADGASDPTFGAGGRVTTDFGGTFDAAYALAVQPDGKLVAAGVTAPISTSTLADFALVRYETDGSLDPTFGTGGRVVTDFAGGFDEARALVIQPDGRIVAAGRNNFQLARYEPDGTLDPTFGQGGLVTTGGPFGFGLLQGRALVLEPDGKLVVGGWIFDNAGLIGGDSFFLARYLADGSLDPSFGDGGRVLTDFPNDFSIFAFNRDVGRGLARQPDGKLVLVGFVFDPVRLESQFALARYQPDGSLDATFGEGGLVRTTLVRNGNDGFAVAVEPGGKIVAAGEASVPEGRHDTRRDLGIVRYLPDGRPDPGFGVCGLVTTDPRPPGAITGFAAEAHAVAIQADGAIVVAGETPVPPVENHFVLARYEGGSLLECAPAPLAGCRAPTRQGKALLQMKHEGPRSAGNRLKWKWLTGAATAFADFGDPTLATDYVLCLYDESGGTPALLLHALTAPAGGTCGDGPCWKTLSTDKGYRFKDGDRVRCGLDSLKLKAGPEGKAKVLVGAKGAGVSLPALPPSLPLRVQVQAGNGACWEAVYSAAGVRKSSATQFKGKAD